MENNVWIDVKDELPKPWTDVLVIHEGRYDIAQYYNDKGNACWDIEHLSMFVSNIRYWQPLPNKPQPKRLQWQYKTRQMEDWKNATDEDYEWGKDLAKFEWRKIEK